MKIHHIGYITNNIEDSITDFSALGYSEGDIFDDLSQNCKICILTSISEGDKIELVEPHQSNIQMLKILKKRGCSVYHICYEVEDIVTTYKLFCDREGWLNIFEPKEAIALDNRLITYFYNTKLGFVEFVEKKKQL